MLLHGVPSISRASVRTASLAAGIQVGFGTPWPCRDDILECHDGSLCIYAWDREIEGVRDSPCFVAVEQYPERGKRAEGTVNLRSCGRSANRVSLIRHTRPW